MKYRSRTEIVSSILEAADGGATKTKIMYKGFLSYGQLQDYLATLVANGLLEYNEREEKFSTTSKGVKFRGISSQLSSMVPRAVDL